MPEQWISASAARSLVVNPPSKLAETKALCARAHAGLVKTRASLLIMGDERAEHGLLPAKFWWAEGNLALEQDWQTGDFSTWIDRTVHWRAFNVTFALNGLLNMLPVERRAIATRGVSIAGDPAWLSAIDTWNYAVKQCDVNPTVATQVIMDQCRLGFVTARVVLMQRAAGGSPGNWDLEEREWDVPIWFWENFTEADSSSQRWDRGVFAGKGRCPDGFRWMTLTGMYFLAESLEVLRPASAREPVTALRASFNVGGRPRKEWWDDLWCAVWGQVYRGDLVPKIQGDIEKAMLDWASAHDHDVSESSIKPCARKMFAEMQREIKNP